MLCCTTVLFVKLLCLLLLELGTIFDRPRSIIPGAFENQMSFKRVQIKSAFDARSRSIILLSFRLQVQRPAGFVRLLPRLCQSPAGVEPTARPDDRPRSSAVRELQERTPKVREGPAFASQGSFLPFSLASRQLSSALWPRIVPSSEVRTSQVGFKWRTSRTSHLSGKSMREIKILRERSAFSSNLLCPVQKTTDVAPSQKVQPDCFCTSSVILLLVKWRSKYLGGSVDPFLEQVACYFREVSMLCFMTCKNGSNEPDCGSFSTKSTRSAAD